MKSILVILVSIVLLIFIKPILRLFIKVPLEISEYKKFMNKLNYIYWIIIPLGLIEHYLFRIADVNILNEPIKFLFAFFSIIFPLVAGGVLQCICPRCTKFLINPFAYFSADSSGMISIEKILKRKSCPRCQFTFKKEI